MLEKKSITNFKLRITTCALRYGARRLSMIRETGQKNSLNRNFKKSAEFQNYMLSIGKKDMKY